MKKHIIFIAAIFCCTGMLPPMAQRASAQVSVSFQVFYDQLSPYGSWVSYPDYGYVWVPGAGAGFRPYGTRGHWVYTEEGWTWVSDYNWGWATFHYGNWFYDDSYGWMWVPGYEWAPAWVTWGEYDGNYCWAPIGPRVDIGVSFSTYRPPAYYWNFCPRNRITSVNVSNYYVRNVHNTTVINNITVINNVNRGGGRPYVRGPQADNVERFTHRPVKPVSIRPSARPGAASVRNGQLAIYRPSVQQNNAAARPTQVRDLHALRPVNNRPGAAGRNPGQGQSAQRPPDRNPGQPQQSRPGQQPGQNRPAQPPQTRPAQQTRPTPQPHPDQPRMNPAQPRPNPQQPNPMPRQPRPVPQQTQPAQRPSQPPQQQHPVQPRPSQPRPAPQQNRPMQQPRQMPQQRPSQPPPHPMPQQHPVQRPVTPPPHPEHHR